MSKFNPFSKKSWKKAGDKIEHTAKKAGDAIEGTAKDAGKEIDKLAKQAEECGMSAIDDIKNLAGKTKKEIEGTANKVKKDIERCADNAKKDIQKEVKNLDQKAQDAMEAALSNLGKILTKEGLKQVRRMVKETHNALEKLENDKPGLINAINELGGKVEIGPLTLSYANFYERTELVVGVLDIYINKPPKLRRKPILDMVRALGPDSIDTGISVQAVALVVGSKELGVGGGINDISLDLFIELGDVILEAMGVPE